MEMHTPKTLATLLERDGAPTSILSDPELCGLVHEIVYQFGTCRKDLCELAWWLRDDMGWNDMRPCDVLGVWEMYRDLPQFGPEFPVGEEKKFRWEYERRVARREAEDAARKAKREAGKPSKRPAKKPEKRQPRQKARK